MAAAELTSPTIRNRRVPARVLPGGELVAALGAVWLLTAIGGLIGRLAPGLAAGDRLHPTLHGSVTDVPSILATNLRLLSVPFVLALLGFHRSHRSRAFGDLLVGGVVTLNCVRVGLALGRYSTRLIPFIPQLPVEWLALALSTSAWISARHGAQPRALRTLALLTFLAAATAAGIEALLTPRAR